jgi:D-inositol-3-phosphate glycosyltransferase
VTATPPAGPRVVILTPYFRPIVGGVESNAERLARYFVAARFGVTVLTKRITKDLPDVETSDGVRIERIGPLGPRSPMAKWLMLPAVTRWLVGRRRDYDAVCSIDCRGVGLGALAARPWSGRPVVMQPQTTGVLAPDGTSGPAASAIKRLLGSLYVRADAVACIARTIEREALSRHVARERVHYLPNAIDMERFRLPTPDERQEARRRFDLADSDVAVVFLGRLSREKGVMELMEAWRLLRGASDASSGGSGARATEHGIGHARLIVAGPDMEGHAWNVGPDARAFAAANRLEDSVRFPGPTKDVTGLMHAADVAVQPSHFEAQGLSAVEALACGVPVVASSVGGLLDFVIDDLNGRICPPKDPQALAAALRSVIEHRDYRLALAARARPSVATDYDERLVFERFASLVRRLAGGRH